MKRTRKSQKTFPGKTEDQEERAVSAVAVVSVLCCLSNVPFRDSDSTLTGVRGYWRRISRVFNLAFAPPDRERF